MAMGLNWITLPLPFVGGVDTKVDELQIPQNKLAVLENVTFNRPKSLRTRNGSRTLTKAIAGGGHITTGEALLAYKNELLVSGQSSNNDGTNLYSYESATPAWIKKGPLVSTSVTAQPVIRDAYAQTQQDGAQHSSGLYVAAWEDTAGGVFYSVLDADTTRQPVVTKKLLSATGIKPKVLAFGNFLAILYVEQATWEIMLALVPVTNPTSLIVATTITANIGPRSLNNPVASYDATVITEATYGEQLYFAFFGTDLNTWICNIPVVTPQSPSVLTAKVLKRGDVVSVFADPSTGGPCLLQWDSGTTGIYLTAYHPLPIAQLVGPIIIPNVAFAPGSTLANGNHYYVVTAVNQAGESTPGPETLITTDVNHNVASLGWLPVVGAISYNVYGRATGAEELLLNTTATNWNDNGSLTPAPPSPPVVNTTLRGVSIHTALVGTRAAVFTLTGIGQAGSVPNLRLAWTQQPGGGLPNATTQQIPVTGAGYTIGVPTTLRSVGLAGKPFVWNGIFYFVLAHGSSLQNTYFVVDQLFNVVGRLLPGNGGGPSHRATLGAACLPETTQPAPVGTPPVQAPVWRVAFLVQDLLTTIPTSTPIANYGTVFYAQTGVVLYSITMLDLVSSYSRAQLGNALVSGGGSPTTYCGQAPTEQGFHLWPGDVQLTGYQSDPNPTPPIVGGKLGANTETSPGVYIGANVSGVYWYVVTYEWTDNYGQVQISAPSEPVTFAVAASNFAGTGSAQLLIPTLRVTSKTGVTVNVYRTIANGPVYYKCATTVLPGASPQTDAPIRNDVLADSVTFYDTLADSVLQQNPQLYTTGGVLENTPTPPLSSLVAWQGRIFGIDPDGVVWFSQPTSTGVPVQFSEYLTQTLDPRGGPTLSLAVQDANLLIFKSGLTLYVNGQGPDSTGANGSFGFGILLTFDVGCANPRSVLSVSGTTLPGGGGSMFQSEKGIFLIGRDMVTVDYIGAEVQELVNGNTVTSAQLIAGSNQVRFTLNTGVAVVYDYYMRQWSVFTPVAAVDSVIWAAGADFAWLDARGLVWVETPGVYNDDGQPIAWKIVTAWLAPSNLQGFQRVREFDIIGQYKSAHQLRVGLAYDYNPAIVQSDLIIPPVPGTWGSDPFWGSTPFWGGDGFRPYQWRVLPCQQKCQSIQITITSAQNGVDPGEGLSLSGITLLVGGRGKLFKLPASATVG